MDVSDDVARRVVDCHQCWLLRENRLGVPAQCDHLVDRWHPRFPRFGVNIPSVPDGKLKQRTFTVQLGMNKRVLGQSSDRWGAPHKVVPQRMKYLASALICLLLVHSCQVPCSACCEACRATPPSAPVREPGNVLLNVSELHSPRWSCRYPSNEELERHARTEARVSMPPAVGVFTQSFSSSSIDCPRLCPGPSRHTLRDSVAVVLSDLWCGVCKPSTAQPPRG